LDLNLFLPHFWPTVANPVPVAGRDSPVERYVNDVGGAHTPARSTGWRSCWPMAEIRRRERLGKMDLHTSAAIGVRKWTCTG
jgi:hypothetical protein